MAEMFTVGEFSRLTHLTVKALHHYHEAGVLPPAQVDAATGYRWYSPAQLADAQLVRRLRQVRMPLTEVRAVLAAPDRAGREAGIATHLARLRLELAGTAAAVASLQALLTTAPEPAPIAHRLAPEQQCLTLAADVERHAIDGWCTEAFARLLAAAERTGRTPVGPGGALYGEGWFELGGGEVTAYLPVDADAPGALPAREPAAGGVVQTTLPGAPTAVIMHEGSFSDLDRSYAALGRHVVELDLGARGPIREIYLVTPADSADPADLRTEVCWPITHLPKES
jgi:DNA-binding transcriptional MerR regulator/effector-binding domain-containing protein